MNLTPELQAFVDLWRNEDAYNNDFHARCTKMVDESKLLKEHRDWIEANQFGFGDRAFHCIWLALMAQMPPDFSFLEIGVFKGQVLSLVGLIAKTMEKKAHIYGVTTLTNTEDVRCRYPAGDYKGWINQIHEHFQVQKPILIVGKSSNPTVVEQCTGFAPYDLVYVDGSHDYPDVVFDIKTYAPMTKAGGFLVMDDASINRLNVGSCWSGLEDVAQAVKDHLDNDPRFKFLLACGHLNLFQRVKD
jgi:hypothetical protein